MQNPKSKIGGDDDDDFISETGAGMEMK